MRREDPLLARHRRRPLSLFLNPGLFALFASLPPPSSLSLSLCLSVSLSLPPGRHQGLLRPAPHRRHRLPRSPLPGRLHPDAQARTLTRLRLRFASLAQGRRPGADSCRFVGAGQEPGDAGRGQRDRAEEAEPVQGQGREGGGHECQAEAREEEVNLIFFFVLLFDSSCSFFFCSSSSIARFVT